LTNEAYALCTIAANSSGTSSLCYFFSVLLVSDAKQQNNVAQGKFSNTEAVKIARVWIRVPAAALNHWLFTLTSKAIKMMPACIVNLQVHVIIVTGQLSFR